MQTPIMSVKRADMEFRCIFQQYTESSGQHVYEYVLNDTVSMQRTNNVRNTKLIEMWTDRVLAWSEMTEEKSADNRVFSK